MNRDLTYEGDGADSQSQIGLEELDNQYDSRGRATTPTGGGRSASEMNMSFQALLPPEHKKHRSHAKVSAVYPENADMKITPTVTLFDKDDHSIVSDNKRVTTTDQNQQKSDTKARKSVTEAHLMIDQEFNLEPGLQSSFSAVRYNDENNEPQPDAQFEGKEISGKLLNEYQQNHMKKFPFEKGQYHQCIPNPYHSNEFITVMLVERSLKLDQIKRSKGQDNQEEALSNTIRVNS